MRFTVQQLDPEDAEGVEKSFGVKNCLVEFNPGKCLMPPHHAYFQQDIIDFTVKEDDVWLLSFPRTGSTWCQEMVWLLGNDLDFDKARTQIQQSRAPLIEMSTVLAELEFLGKDLLENSVQLISNFSSPRYIRSHLPLPLLPTQLDKIKPKIIYTCRNPKDTCVSFYHYCQMVHQYKSPFEEFCEQFLRGLNPVGSFFSHSLNLWNKRHESNVLFLKYEDMKKDLRGTLKTIADFLNKSYSEQDYDKLCEFLSFQKMRNNKSVNLEATLEDKYGKGVFDKLGHHFIRKGQVGDWKNFMSPEMAKRFDDWIEENTKGTGLNWD